jgi:hypothetical protein
MLKNGLNRSRRITHYCSLDLRNLRKSMIHVLQILGKKYLWITRSVALRSDPVWRL